MFAILLSKQLWTKYLIVLDSILMMETAELKGAEISIIEPLDHQVVQRRSVSNGEVLICDEMDDVPSCRAERVDATAYFANVDRSRLRSCDLSNF